MWDSLWSAQPGRPNNQPEIGGSEFRRDPVFRQGSRDERGVSRDQCRPEEPEGPGCGSPGPGRTEVRDSRAIFKYRCGVFALGMRGDDRRTNPIGFSFHHSDFPREPVRTNAELIEVDPASHLCSGVVGTIPHRMIGTGRAEFLHQRADLTARDIVDRE